MAAPRLVLLSLASLALVAGCLPDTLSDAELQARISADGAADATGSDAAQSQDTQGPLCGNGKLDPGEECDQGAKTCGECELCRLRRALETQAPTDLAITGKASKLDFRPDQDVSWSLWFKMRKEPSPGSLAFVVTLAAEQKKVGTITVENFVSFAMGLSRGPSTSAFPACVLSARLAGLESVAAVNWPDTVKVGQWHHMRCYYRAGDKKISISVDGGKPKHASVDLKGAAASLPVGTGLMLGAVPPTAGGELNQTFDGWLDELHVTHQVPENVWQQPARRVDAAAGSVLLYHMDLQKGQRQLVDAAPNPLPAQQYDPAKKQLESADFKWSPEDCYGYAPTCEGAGQGPWCP